MRENFTDEKGEQSPLDQIAPNDDGLKQVERENEGQRLISFGTRCYNQSEVFKPSNGTSATRRAESMHAIPVDTQSAENEDIETQKSFEKSRHSSFSIENEITAFRFSFRKLWSFAGPGLLMSSAYLDPGKSKYLNSIQNYAFSRWGLGCWQVCRLQTVMDLDVRNGIRVVLSSSISQARSSNSKKSSQGLQRVISKE